jgi:hypothetical protein
MATVRCDLLASEGGGWLAGVVNEGPGVRLRLEAREKEGAALRKQLLEDARVSYRNLISRVPLRLVQFTGSSPWAAAGPCVAAAPTHSTSCLPVGHKICTLRRCCCCCCCWCCCSLLQAEKKRRQEEAARRQEEALARHRAAAAAAQRHLEELQVRPLQSCC